MTKFEQLLVAVDALRALIVEAAKEVPPTVKVLVMPAENSKEEFALSAMAEAMGLTVTDATLVEEVRGETPKSDAVKEAAEAAGLPVLDVPMSVEDRLTKVIAEITAEEQVGAPQTEVVAPSEPEEPETPKGSLVNWDWRKDVRSNVADKDATSNGIRISKTTGKPVRKYERSGKFATKDKPYRARRMS